MGRKNRSGGRARHRVMSARAVAAARERAVIDRAYRRALGRQVVSVEDAPGKPLSCVLVTGDGLRLTVGRRLARSWGYRV